MALFLGQDVADFIHRKSPNRQRRANIFKLKYKRRRVCLRSSGVGLGGISAFMWNSLVVSRGHAEKPLVRHNSAFYVSI